jgi:hypothetical protein
VAGAGTHLAVQLLDRLEQLESLVAGEGPLVGTEHGDGAVEDQQLM